MSYFTERMSRGRGTSEEQISRLKSELEAAEVVVIGAGAGLSTSAGFTYSGERFEKYFVDFATSLEISLSCSPSRITTFVAFKFFRFNRGGLLFSAVSRFSLCLRFFG